MKKPKTYKLKIEITEQEYKAVEQIVRINEMVYENGELRPVDRVLKKVAEGRTWK